MEAWNLGVTIIGLLLTNVAVVFQFKHQKSQLEDAAKARAADETRLRSEEKRWAHGQLADKRLTAMMATLRFVARCRVYMALPTAILNHEQKSEAEKAFVNFWKNTDPHIKDRFDTLTKELIDGLVPVVETRYWLTGAKDLSVVKAFIKAYETLFMLVIQHNRVFDEWKSATKTMLDQCEAMELWFRTQLDPETVVAGMHSAAASDEK
ncbi:MAG: hypothetical protein KDB68_09665 [Planctomycetes bacterium]|nr:hypothetical protein [Planctomycetota bacterium]